MRVFLALALPEPLQLEIADRLDVLRPGLPDARYTPAGNLHLTLHFFGERSADRLAELAAALEPVVASHAPFTATISSAGSFPARSRPRVVWLGLAPSPPLAGLHSDARQSLSALGEAVDERPFHPHVTLARPKQPWARADVATVRHGLSELEGRSFDAAAVVVYESLRGPRGSTYQVRRQLDLAGRAAGGG
jgi:2'-5' RNA ligase